MNHMATSFLKSIKIFYLFSKANFLTGLEYRFDFITGIIPTLAYFLAYFAFMNVVFGKITTINGWTFNQMLTLFAIEQIFFYGTYLFFKSSLINLSESIKDGTLDQYLRLPANTRVLISFKDQTPDMIPAVIASVFLLVYSLRETIIYFPNVILFIILSVCGFLILYNIMFIFSSLAFWLTESDELVELSSEISQLGRFPPSIFPLAAQAFIFFIIPAALMIFVPATALMGTLDWKLGFLSVIMTLVTYLISRVIWENGLKQYSSASS